MDEHERLTEFLRQAQLTESEASREARDENLRRLVRAAVPQAEASDALKRRVEGLIAADRSRRPSFLARIVPQVRRRELLREVERQETTALQEATASKHDSAARRGWAGAAEAFRGGPGVQRRWLVGVVPIAAAAVVLFFVMNAGSPVQASLDRTLDAMSHVRSARCSGWAIGYFALTREGKPKPERAAVRWWYRAPDQYRREIRPEPGSEGGSAPQTLIIRGEVAVRLNVEPSVPGINVTLPAAQLTRELSPFDFFSREGILRRAAREKHARVAYRKSKDGGRPVDIIAVAYRTETIRHRWVLTVDPASGLVMQADHTWTRRTGSTWEPALRSRLTRFDYDIPVPDALFATVR